MFLWVSRSVICLLPVFELHSHPFCPRAPSNPNKLPHNGIRPSETIRQEIRKRQLEKPRFTNKSLGVHWWTIIVDLSLLITRGTTKETKHVNGIRRPHLWKHHGCGFRILSAFQKSCVQVGWMSAVIGTEAAVHLSVEIAEPNTLGLPPAPVELWM